MGADCPVDCKACEEVAVSEVKVCELEPDVPAAEDRDGPDKVPLDGVGPEGGAEVGVVVGLAPVPRGTT